MSKWAGEGQTIYVIDIIWICRNSNIWIGNLMKADPYSVFSKDWSGIRASRRSDPDPVFSRRSDPYSFFSKDWSGINPTGSASLFISTVLFSQKTHSLSYECDSGAYEKLMLGGGGIVFFRGKGITDKIKKKWEKNGLEVYKETTWETKIWSLHTCANFYHRYIH